MAVLALSTSFLACKAVLKLLLDGDPMEER
jgi:hypothetical protein